MNLKKIGLAVVVAFVILMATDFLVHGMWMTPTYTRMQTDLNTFRSTEQMEAKMWLMWVGRLLFSALFVWVYTRGLEAKAWLGQGIRYAILIWLFFGVPAALDQYVLYRVPYKVAACWMVASAVQLLLISLTTAAICKKAPAAA